MRALLMHDDITPDTAVADALSAAGYDIVRCSEAGAPRFPCSGAGGSCPLDGSVDVAVVVHDRPAADLAVGEVGVVCAFRDGVPVVLAGSETQSPFEGRCEAVAGDVADVPAACERAVTSAMDRASEFVSRYSGTDVRVARHGHRVQVELCRDGTAAHAVLAHQAAARLFPSARTIDVRRAPVT
jgi:hypothetical protein